MQDRNYSEISIKLVQTGMHSATFHYVLCTSINIISEAGFCVLIPSGLLRSLSSKTCRFVSFFPSYNTELKTASVCIELYSIKVETCRTSAFL